MKTTPTLQPPYRNNRTILRLYAIVAFLVASPAFACGGIFDVECNLNNGGLSPENLGHQAEIIGQDVGNAVNELQANLTGPALEQMIINSRNSAINESMPMPPEMRRLLTGYASDYSMDRVRYKVGDNGFINLARLLEHGGFASAVTLIDVIVFRGPSEAADPSIWAHELTHVDQYGNDTHGFAVRYTRNFHVIEDPAYAKGNGYWEWRSSNRSQVSSNSGGWAQSTPPPVINPTRFIPGTQMLYCGCYGPGPAFALEPRCASGGVQVVICGGQCQGGGSPYGYVCQ